VPKPEHGRIVWATMRSSSGTKRKKRTAVILARTKDIIAGEPFVVVAITKTFPEPPLEDHVPFQNDPTGRCVTRLKNEQPRSVRGSTRFSSPTSKSTRGLCRRH